MRIAAAILLGLYVAYSTGYLGYDWIKGYVQELVPDAVPATMSDSRYIQILSGVIAACVALPGLVAAVLLMRFTRPTNKSHHCRCGYDLTGNTSGRCPECGTGVESAKP